jgi:hypothetical protein
MKATRFDHVAAEVAYLIVQIGAYMGESRPALSVRGAPAGLLM